MRAEPMPVETRLRHYSSGSFARPAFFNLHTGGKEIMFKVTYPQRRRLEKKRRRAAA